MGKTHRGHKEFSKEQRLLHENQRLRRQLSALRKQLSRIDLDRYTGIKEILDQHYEKEDAERILENAKKQWTCYECRVGFMAIKIINRRDGKFYFRACTSCKHRTKLQPYSESVKGIFVDEED